MTDTIFVRMRLILIGLAVLAAIIVVQLFRIQFASTTKVYFEDLSVTISQREREFSPARGRIYDRDGELLATNDVQYELGISPNYVVNAEDVSETLSDLLDKSVGEIRASTQLTTPYVLIERPVSAEVGAQIKALTDTNLSGVSLTPIAHRVYPGAMLGAQVLGFVGYAGDRQVGYYGVEGFYNDVLSGRSVQGVERIVPFEAQPEPVPAQGADLYLTIDRDVQFLIEGVLASAIQLYGADGGTVIVMNPRSGEILGMASYPTFDPNRYAENLPETPINPAVSAQFEPGSTFKILTMAAALDSGLVTPDTPFYDSGLIEVGGVPIRNWDGGAWGPVDMLGCMQHSLNVCLASLSVQLGPTTYYNYMSAFGVGSPTGVDLAAEAAGRLKVPGDSDWFESDLGANAFGQGVALTPLQLIASVAAVANGGTMMQPHILREVRNGDYVHVTRPQVLGRPIRPETAAVLSQMLAQSIRNGEGDQALVPGYSIAGKTGTAQIPIPGGYDPTRTIASFVGWGPVDDPQFVVLVKLDRPSTSIWGSETAAPVFSGLVRRLVVLMRIPPDAVRAALAGR